MDQFLSAEQLNITEAKRNALLSALAVMESGGIVHHTDSSDLDETVFHMNTWGGDYCGTCCCIGGLAEKLSPGVHFHDDIDFYDITDHQLKELFYPGSVVNSNRDVHYDGVTVAQGAQALRNFLTTGAANWSSIPDLPRERD